MSLARETGRAARSTQKILVAAIDFGTTYSGYAYSFLSDFKKDPLAIYANTEWNSGGMEGLVTDKTPTTILFKPNGDFHSFGYDAENKYDDLVNDDDHQEWYYFSRFKMTLHGQTVGSNARIKISVNNIIFTAPVIFKDGHAGIPNNHLLDLALEPEAAAIYCKSISVKTDGSSFEPGTQFVLVDLGGGTADITIHELGESGNLIELSPPSGGRWGGTKVDAAFDNLLKNVYGEHVVSSFTQKKNLVNLT